MADHPALRGYHPTIPSQKLSNEVLDTSTMDQLRDDFEDGLILLNYWLELICDYLMLYLLAVSNSQNQFSCCVWLISTTFPEFVESDTLLELLLYRKEFDRQKLVRIFNITVPRALALIRITINWYFCLMQQEYITYSWSDKYSRSEVTKLDFRSLNSCPITTQRFKYVVDNFNRNCKIFSNHHAQLL